MFRDVLTHIVGCLEGRALLMARRGLTLSITGPQNMSKLLHSRNLPSIFCPRLEPFQTLQITWSGPQTC